MSSGEKAVVKPQVNVVSFIVCRDEKILAEKRKQTKEIDPGKVTIPGGHVEKGESFEAALEREVREELGIECDRFAYLITMLHETDKEDQVTHYYVCENWKGEPRNLEAEQILWIGFAQIDQLDVEIDRKAAKEFLRKRTHSQ
jgi:mutator protein MutT